MLIAGRTLQGIGSGGIVPMVQTTVADMVTPRERGHYQAYMGSAWVAAGVAGPALGGRAQRPPPAPGLAAPHTSSATTRLSRCEKRTGSDGDPCPRI